MIRFSYFTIFTTARTSSIVRDFTSCESIFTAQRTTSIGTADKQQTIAIKNDMKEISALARALRMDSWRSSSACIALQSILRIFLHTLRHRVERSLRDNKLKKKQTERNEPHRLHPKIARPANRPCDTHSNRECEAKLTRAVRDYGVYAIPCNKIERKKKRVERTILTFVKFGTYKCVAISSADADGSCCCSNTGTSLKFAGFSVVKPFPCACNKKRLLGKNNNWQISKRFDSDVCVGKGLMAGLPLAFTQNRNFELSGLFCSWPLSAFKMRWCFFTVMVFVLAKSPYVLITHGW